MQATKIHRNGQKEAELLTSWHKYTKAAPILWQVKRKHASSPHSESKTRSRSGSDGCCVLSLELAQMVEGIQIWKINTARGIISLPSPKCNVLLDYACV